MKRLIVLEELFFVVLAVFLFSGLPYSWWLFPLLLFTPDVSMLGYLASPRFGAITYNLIHHKATGVIAYVLGALFGYEIVQLVGVILLAHSSLDRVFGYGLKHSDSFNHTHLGWIGLSRKDKTS